MQNLELQNQKRKYEKFHIISIAKQSQISLIKFEDNNYVFDVDNEQVRVYKDERSRLVLDCHCKDCAYYNIKKRNVLCRRQLAVYNYLFNSNGYIESINLEKVMELDLP